MTSSDHSQKALAEKLILKLKSMGIEDIEVREEQGEFLVHYSSIATYREDGNDEEGLFTYRFSPDAQTMVMQINIPDERGVENKLTLLEFLMWVQTKVFRTLVGYDFERNEFYLRLDFHMDADFFDEGNDDFPIAMMDHLKIITALLPVVRQVADGDLTLESAEEQFEANLLRGLDYFHREFDVDMPPGAPSIIDFDLDDP